MVRRTKVSEYIFENILQLDTPVGYFSVNHGRLKIPFSVKKNSYNVPYNIYDMKNEHILDTVQIETNYAIVIDVNEMKVGSLYSISFSNGQLKFCDSDEHTEAFTTTINNWSIGIGSYNPNDDEEYDQAEEYSKKLGTYAKGTIVEPPFYDESKLRKYRVWFSERANGFKFKLLDKSIEKIVFPVAWMKNDELESFYYEDALSFWLT